MKNKSYTTLLIFAIMIILSSTFVSALTQYDITIDQSSYNLGWGKSVNPKYTITCQNSFWSCNCQVLCSGASSYQSVGSISANDYKEFSTCSYSAPTSGKDNYNFEIRAACIDSLESDYKQKTASTYISYPTSQEWSQYQTAESAKTAASNVISSANSAINKAKNRINEASGIGADVSSATQYINSAESDYSSANTYLSSGNSAYNSKDYSSASSYYQQAQSKASTAQSNAANAESMVDKIIEEYNKKKTEAQNKVSDSNSAIDTAKQRIDAADKVIKDATVIGLDTAQAKADIATARSKIDTAEDYYSEASNLFSADNFEGAKSKAQSGINLADEAEDIATNAYNSLHERLNVAGESSKAILNANSEVSQMNEILTKMDYIVRSTEKWGVDLTETKSVVSTAKTNVDSAEDLLSKAKNRLDSGSLNEAVNFANQARDKAASSRNRLDTMTQTISLSTQDALEKAYADLLQEKIKLAEAEVKSAQNTYGATPSLIVDAQNDISAAKNSLTQSKKDIESVKTASGLIPLLEKTEAAFKSLDSSEKKIISAIANAKSAKSGLTKKIAIGAAIAAAAGGGGFLYYRKRKKKKKEIKERVKREEKPEKKEVKKKKYSILAPVKKLKKVAKVEREKEKHKEVKKEIPLKNCPNCKAKLKKGQNFCSECGEEV